MGVGRLRRHQLLRELHGSASPAVRARQHADVRRARHAPVQRCTDASGDGGRSRLMPLAGSLDIHSLLEAAPSVTLSERELRIDNVEILQVIYEIAAVDIEALVPP